MIQEKELESDRYRVQVTKRRKETTLKIIDRAFVLAAINDCSGLMNGRQYVSQDKWTKGREEKARREVADMNATDLRINGPCDMEHPEVRKFARMMH